MFEPSTSVFKGLLAKASIRLQKKQIELRAEPAESQ